MSTARRAGRWLTLLMNRVDPALFSAAFTAFVRETWPERPELIAIDGKTSRRSHDRADDKAPLHLVSAFATASRLVLGQEAVEGKSNELSAIPVLLDRLSDDGGLKGALVSIDAIAANAKIAQAIVDKGADYLLAVKANQPMRKGHGARNMAVVRHFAVNLIRIAPEPERPPPMKPQRKATKPRHTSISLRRKIAGWRAASARSPGFGALSASAPPPRMAKPALLRYHREILRAVSEAKWTSKGCRRRSRR